MRDPAGQLAQALQSLGLRKLLLVLVLLRLQAQAIRPWFAAVEGG